MGEPVAWDDLDPMERAVLCSLWKEAEEAWHANVPPRVLLRNLHPKLRDMGEMMKALKRLIRKGLAAWYPARRGRTVTITPQGKKLARQHCIEDWENIRQGKT